MLSSPIGFNACRANENRGLACEPAVRARIILLFLALGALVATNKELLHAPVQDLGDVDFILGRAGDLVDPAELLELLARLAHHAKHLAVKRELVEAARESVGNEHDLVRAGRDADRPGRASSLSTAGGEIVGQVR